MLLKAVLLSLGGAFALATAAQAAVTPEEALARATAHVRANASALGVAAADLTDLAVTSSYASAHNGVTHVNLNQRYQGLEVFGGHVSVAVKADGSILHAAGSLVPSLAAGASGSPVLEAVDAVEAAAASLGLGAPTDLRVLTTEGGPARRTTCSSAGVSRAPIPARLGWQPTADGLRRAWQLVIDDSCRAAHVERHRGRADRRAPRRRGLDDPRPARRAPGHAGRRPARRQRAHRAPEPGHRRVELSRARAAHGEPERPRAPAIDNPADGDASPFGWHDTDGAVGPEFTITRGNNAHAYLDQDAGNQPDFGQDVDGGAGLDFDFPADLAQHSQAYRPAVTTNLFYGCNVIHDITWRYGFDEASGNFQMNNYGRGGTGGDFVRCEAADGNGTNNANFNTPAADGQAPRMQMFLWPGNQFGPQNEVVANGVSYAAAWARFGPPASNAGVSGQIINAGNGCVAADYAGAPAGDWMAIVTSSGNVPCTNINKARAAATAGAKAVIIAATNDDDPAPILTGSQTTAPPAIPAVSVTQVNGNAIRAAIAAGAVAGTVRKDPDHPAIRDGDFENGIIFHEYGHGISNRLTGGLNVNCLNGNEQAGEGWSDYYALTLVLDPALDNPQGPRGMGPYALFQANRQGNGIRPRPYSRDMTIQPFTYDSIKTGAWLNGVSLSTPHGIGHGWNSILWDMTWDLIDKHEFNPDLYGDWNTGGNNRSLQYVTDGLKLQGCSPGFIAARNGILAAAAALGGADTCTVWATFARRGAGFSAVQGTTNRDDNTEAFDTHPSCRQGFKSPVTAPYGTLNVRDAGSTVPLKFTIPGATGLDVLASNSPFSRKVDCATLRVPSSGAFITPREYPIATERPATRGSPPTATASTTTTGRRSSNGRAPAARWWSPAPTASSTARSSASTRRSSSVRVPFRAAACATAAALVSLPAPPAPAASPAVPAAMAPCADCHAAVVRSYLGHGMARSVGPRAPSPRARSRTRAAASATRSRARPSPPPTPTGARAASAWWGGSGPASSTPRGRRRRSTARARSPRGCSSRRWRPSPATASRCPRSSTTRRPRGWTSRSRRPA